MSGFEYVRERCIIITAITDNNFSTPTVQDDQEAEARVRRKKRRYRMKKRLKVLLMLLLLAAICAGGYYAYEHYPWKTTAEPQVVPKPKEEISVVGTSSIYLYNHKYVNGNLEILGMILSPELQYKTSQYRLVGKDLYIRIQAEPNGDKQLKEFGFKVPCDMNKIKNIYLQGPEEKDKVLKWQNPVK